MEQILILSIVFYTIIICLLLVMIIRQNKRLKEKDETILDITNENSRLAAIHESYKNYKSDIERINENSKNSFASAAKDLFITTSSNFTAINKTSVEGLLKPLWDQIEVLKKQNTENRSSMETNIRNLVEQTEKISQDAVALTKALKGDKKLQGNWGEALLSTILCSSGLKEGTHYFLQKTFTDENGHSFRPDVVVALPQEESKIIIDSKVSLNAYVDYCNAENESDKEMLLQKHVEAIKNHVIELAVKDYSRLVKGSIGFVLMFVANEASYITAIERMPSLLEFARQRKVIIVSPANLITALQLTLLLWRTEQQKQNIAKIIEQGSNIYDKFVLFTESFTKIGDTLKAANDSYETSYKRLSEGRDNLIGKLEKFRELGLQPTKQLSSKFTDIDEN